MRIEVIGPGRAHVRSAVQWASFDGSTFTDEHWHAMAAGLPYADARRLVAYDDQGNGVAAVTVWSAGPGKPGLLEPMGVHREHRGLGYGKGSPSRGGRTAAAGLVERYRLHSQLQYRCRRDLQVSWLPV